MKICRTCVKHLRICYNFLTLVKKSQQSIKEFRKEEKSNGNKYESKIERKRSPSEQISTKDDLYITEDSNYLLQPEIKTETGDVFTFTCSRCNKRNMDSEEYLRHRCELKKEIEIKNDKSINELLFNLKTNSKEDEVQKVTKKVKTKQSERVYECQHCQYICLKMWQLRKHLKQTHDKEKKYACSFCDKAFKQAYHLREHISTHTGERNYVCPICEKAFVRLSSHRRHVKSHDAAPGQKTKRTPFLCTVCGKSFPFSNGVQRHMRVHFGIKKYECQVCKRRFVQSTHLSVHMRTHTGEKPYICDICGDAFSLNCSLQKHMNVHKVLDIKIENIAACENNEK